ncbi:MAG TPA: class I SAM-dependent methyltransferase [Cyclobacteriaceae bacterium]|nr:class I SAM-dependent methyltransferase [Cyclobacteriaceae bacterium]
MDQAAKYKYSEVTKLGSYRKTALMSRLFESHFPPLSENSKIVEIGPGRGEFAQECIRRKFDYTGIEPSETLADVLRSEGYNILSQKVPPLYLTNNDYDLIHSKDVIEHLKSYEEVLDLLADCRLALRDGGYISAIVPNFATLKELFYEYEYQHAYPTTEMRMQNLLEDSGFQVIKLRKVFCEIGLSKFCFLDRLLAHLLIPIARNSVFCAMVKMITSREILFKIHKNVYDHIYVLGKKV